MVKKGNFPEGMEWKEKRSSDLKPDAEIASLDLERLELVKPILLSSVKSTQLEEAGLWGEAGETTAGRGQGSVSRVGINACVKLKKSTDCIFIMFY